MLGNKNAALLLYAAHISAALLFAFISGLLIKDKNIYYGDGGFNNNFTDNALSQSVYSAAVSVFSVGVLIAVFYMLTDMLSALPLLEGFFGSLLSYCGIPHDIARGLGSGIIEMTRGCNTLAGSTASLTVKLCCISFVLSFGGGCVLMQSFAFLNGKIKYGLFILYKLIHAFLSALICLPLCLIFGII